MCVVFGFCISILGGSSILSPLSRSILLQLQCCIALGFRVVIVGFSLGKSEPCGVEALSSELTYSQ